MIFKTKLFTVKLSMWLVSFPNLCAIPSFPTDFSASVVSRPQKFDLLLLSPLYRLQSNIREPVGQVDSLVLNNAERAPFCLRCWWKMSIELRHATEVPIENIPGTRISHFQLLNCILAKCRIWNLSVYLDFWELFLSHAVTSEFERIDTELLHANEY
jgi:hypothetical protein